ncbi:MAG: STAS domain-containing protein [Phycisphaerales bacterium]|jgi:anti-anti-sigma factor
MAICDYSDNIIVIELPGEPDLRAELDRAIEILQTGCNSDVIMNFSKVDIMTSMSLSGFLKVREVVCEAGKQMIFCNAKPITKDIFKITCFDGVFEFADTLDQAVEALSKVKNC